MVSCWDGPAIAVVLPFCNARPWLAEAIASLTNAAAGLPWQLIAVNDGSSDAGPALLQALTAHWPAGQLLLLEGGGRGVSAARNRAIAAASAPLIAFLDADDRALPERLRAPLAALQADPGLDHVHGGWLRIDAAGQLISSVEPWREGAGFDRHAALTHKAVLPSAWTVRRSALQAVGGFDESLRHAEDVDLLLRLAAAGHHGAWIPRPLVRYRVHAGGASRELRGQIEGLADVVDRHLQDLPPEQAAWAAGISYGTLSWGAWKAWSEGDHALALAVLGRAAAACPLPLVRRPVHFLEHVARSCAREGLPFEPQAFLASGFWQQAQAQLLTVAA
jgi:glycosyltransferase involved in cell wall biosynthesis